MAGVQIILTQSQFSGILLNGSENGTFTSATAITDPNGIARVRFIAGMKQGPAVLRAYFVYKNPPGRDMVMGASEVITVGSADLWEIHAEYRFEEELVQDTAWIADGLSFTYHQEGSLAGSVTMRGLLRADYDLGNLYLEEIVSMSIAGIWLRNTSVNSRSYHPLVGLGRAEVSLYRGEGIAMVEDEYGNPSGIYFSDEGGDNMTINVAPVFSGLHYWHVKEYDLSAWKTREGEQVEDRGFPFEYDHGVNGTILRSNNQYTASFATVDSSFSPDPINGTTRTITRTYLNAIIRPFSPVSSVDNRDERSIPQHFQLFQNYPNPFNPGTEIRFDLPEDGKVRVEVLNVLGEKVVMLYDGFMDAGFGRSVRWDADGFSSGVYFYRVSLNGKYVDVKKMVLVK